MTTEHDALLRAICDHPDEDTPRLAFADLVEEHGDAARGRFVRTQVALAAAPEFDPLWVKCRQLEPEAVRGWAMAHTLPPLPDGFTAHVHRFRRGFPWLVLALSAEAFARRSADLLARAPVQALCFDSRSGSELAELADAPDLARLRRLDFADAHLDAGDLAPLLHSRFAAGLTELRFEAQGVTGDGLAAVAASPAFPRLAALRLQNNLIPPDLLVDALAAAPEASALRRLALPDCQLTEADVGHLCRLPVVRNLGWLDLSQNPLGPDGVEALAQSGAVRGLEVLKLAETRPGVPGVKALAQTSAAATVRWLDLSANRLGPQAAAALAGSRHARGLRVLDLSDNPSLGDRGAAALAESRHLAGLLELNLKDCGVGDAGARALAESPHLGGLLRLDIRDGVLGRNLGDDTRARLLDRFGPSVSL